MDFTIIARQSDGFLLCEDRGGARYDLEQEHLRKQAGALIKKTAGRTRHGDITATIVDANDSKHKFYVSVGAGLTLVSLFQASYPQKLALCFLEEVRNAFREEIKREHGAAASQSYDSLIETASRPYQYIRFERVIQRKRTQFKDPRSHESLKRLNQNLTEITDIMQKNINDLILRGENLEDVNRRADDLREKSQVFAKMAKKMSLRAWLETCLPFLTLGIVCSLVAVFVFVW